MIIGFSRSQNVDVNFFRRFWHVRFGQMQSSDSCERRGKVRWNGSQTCKVLYNAATWGWFYLPNKRREKVDKNSSISSISCMTQISFLPFKMYFGLWPSTWKNARNKLNIFFLIQNCVQWYQSIFWSGKKLFCGKHRVVKQKKEKILFSLHAWRW